MLVSLRIQVSINLCIAIIWQDVNTSDKTCSMVITKGEKIIYGLFGCLKREGEESKGGENNLITLFGSFLRKEGEGFGGVSTTSNP